jgi:hypothetical protein
LWRDLAGEPWRSCHRAAPLVQGSSALAGVDDRPDTNTPVHNYRRGNMSGATTPVTLGTNPMALLQNRCALPSREKISARQNREIPPLAAVTVFGADEAVFK